MAPQVTILDYGLGNIHSIANALRACDALPTLSADPEAVAKADRLILPGVGAFRDGMDGLSTRGLVQSIWVFAATGRPFLGICLGMQMMLQTSFEFGSHEGLGLIPGTVDAIPPTGAGGEPHKIPHIGWNRLLPVEGSEWRGSILAGVEPGARVYFVHSFTANPEQAQDRLANTEYNGLSLTAALRHENLFGCQFHPEKSGKTGLTILQNFLNLR
jgi:glutamine amidotransferase